MCVYVCYMNVHVLLLEPDCLMWVQYVNMTETQSFNQMKTPTCLLHISPLSLISASVWGCLNSSTLCNVNFFVTGVIQASWVNTVNIGTPASLGTA